MSKKNSSPDQSSEESEEIPVEDEYDDDEDYDYLDYDGHDACLCFLDSFFVCMSGAFNFFLISQPLCK